MFTDGIEFFNNIGDICKTFANNTEENNMDSLKLIEAVVNIKNYVKYSIYEYIEFKKIHFLNSFLRYIKNIFF